MFTLGNIKQIINQIETCIQLFQLLKCRHYAVEFSDFTPGYVEEADIFKRSADVTERMDHRVIQFQRF